MRPEVTTLTTVEVTAQIELDPAVVAGLTVELEAYAAKRMQVKRLEAEMEEHKRTIDVTRALTGEKRLDMNGYTIALVEPVQSRLDKAALMRAGVSVAQIEAGTVVRPAKPYTRIMCPNDGDE